MEREYPDQRPAFLFSRPAISGAGAELLAQSIYWEEFERMAVRTIEQFPVWKKSVKKIQKSGNLYEWLTRDIKASTRQAEILTKVLSDIFEELN